MATKPKTAPADEAGGAVAVAGSSAVVEYEDYGDATGFENLSSDDYAIPFLGMLQALSPELQNPTPETENYKQGMILNSVTGEIFPSSVGVPFVPCHIDHCFMEWKPRAAGGGLVGRHELSADVIAHAQEKAGTTFGLLKSPEGNDLIETRYLYGVYLDAEGNPQPAVISFSSTKMKVIKGWVTKASGIQLVKPDGTRQRAPLFAHRYRLKSVSEKNNKGQFFNWAVTFDGEDARSCRMPKSDPVFQAAVALRDMVISGKAKAAVDTLQPGGDTEEADGNGAAGTPTAGGRPVF